MSHFGEMTNYFEDFGGNFEVFVGAIKEEVRIEANHAEGPLTKVLQMVTENRLLAGGKFFKYRFSSSPLLALFMTHFMWCYCLLFGSSGCHRCSISCFLLPGQT